MTKRGRVLRRADVQALLGKVGHAHDEELSQVLRCHAYSLEDGGELLVFADGSARHYESRRDLVATYEKTSEEARRVKRGFDDVIPNVNTFVDDVPQLIAALPRLLGMTTDILDVTRPETVVALDTALRRSRRRDILTAAVFPSILAYVGEVVRTAIGGSWQVQTHSDGGGEIDVADSHGHCVGLLRIYKELLEHGRAASLAAFVDVAVRRHRSS